MARKNNPLNPAMYGLTQQDVDRVIRIHSMCKDMDEDAFEQMETAAAVHQSGGQPEEAGQPPRGMKGENHMNNNKKPSEPLETERWAEILS